MQLLLLLFQCSRFVGILKHVSWLRRKRTFLESFETQSIMNNRLFRGFFLSSTREFRAFVTGACHIRRVVMNKTGYLDSQIISRYVLV